MDKKYSLITLITDFGTKDAFVGTMKGVILSICPDVEIVDISHEVPKYNIRYGAFLLSQVAPYYPEGTIHMVVIDPGVGISRRRIIVKGEHCLYVGPDNGVFSFVMEKERVVKAVEITDKRFMLPPVSSTFEGRDVFAPVAAYLAKGVKLEEFGSEIQDLVRLPIARVETIDETITGEIIHIDSFGNIVTNIQRDSLNESKIVEGSFLKITTEKGSNVVAFCKTYSEVPTGELLTIIGSCGFLEIAVNQGSAEALLKTEIGNVVKLSLVKRNAA